jgi:hypothetical protein
MFRFNQEAFNSYHQEVIQRLQFYLELTVLTGYIILTVSTLFLVVGMRKKWWKLPKIIEISLYVSLICQLFMAFIFISARVYEDTPSFSEPIVLPLLLIFFTFIAPLLCFIFNIAWRSDIHLRLRYAIILGYVLLLVPAAAMYGYAIGIWSISQFTEKVQPEAQP